MTEPTKVKTSSYRHRGFVNVDGSIIEVFGNGPAPAGPAISIPAAGIDGPVSYPILWDHWVVESSTTVPYASQDVVPPTA